MISYFHILVAIHLNTYSQQFNSQTEKVKQKVFHAICCVFPVVKVMERKHLSSLNLQDISSFFVKYQAPDHVLPVKRPI
jgi:hypothetical protein